MTEINTSWFHCGRCGSLFQAPIGEVGDRNCAVCGRNPSLGIEAPALESAPPPGAYPADAEDRPAEREKHPLRKRRHRYFMTKLVLGWLALLLLIVFGARHFWQQDSSTKKPYVSQTPANAVVSEADVELLNKASPLCSQTFTGYLAATTPEERNQFVLSPITTAARMARYFSINPLVSIEPGTLKLTNTSVVHLPGRQAIETQWTTTDGRLLDAVFIEENGEWKLDWDHFIRYSDNPWALFLAGGETDRGEFRLLARERLAEERKNADSISVVLYAPRFGYADETGTQSPEFVVKRDTRNGRLLDAAFKLERSGDRPFGVNLPNLNPDDMIRVRVKVRRFETDGVRRFEIEEVLACHWYSVDEPGVEIPEQAKK